MANASGSLNRLVWIEEDSFGVTPPTTPQTTEIKKLTHNLKALRDAEVSEEITSDRMARDVLTGTVGASLDITGYLRKTEFDPFLEGVMMNTFPAPGSPMNTGSTMKHLTVQESQLDLGTIVHRTGLGITPKSFTISASQGDKGVNFSCNCVGKIVLTDTLEIDPTPTAVSNNKAFNAFVGAATIAGSGTNLLTAFEVTVDNGIEVDEGMFTIGALNTTPGGSTVTGSATMYVADKTIEDRDISKAPFTLAVQFTDADANDFTISMGAVTILTYDKPVGGRGSLFQTFTFAATYASGPTTDIALTYSA